MPLETKTSAGIPTFRTVEDAARARFMVEHPEYEVEHRGNRVQKVWIADEQPPECLVVVRHVSRQNGPVPQFSFYRVDTRSLQAWRIEDARRQSQLRAAAERELHGTVVDPTDPA